jgi:hypothetical protein
MPQSDAAMASRVHYSQNDQEEMIEGKDEEVQ